MASPKWYSVRLPIWNFCGTTPCQIALAQYMQLHPEHIRELSQFYQTKRDRFNHAIHNSRFLLKPSQGTYFQNLDYSQIRPDLNDVEMCQFLAEQHKIVAIPVSVFYQQAPESLRLIRFCCFLKMMKHCKKQEKS